MRGTALVFPVFVLYVVTIGRVKRLKRKPMSRAFTAIAGLAALIALSASAATADENPYSANSMLPACTAVLAISSGNPAAGIDPVLQPTPLKMVAAPRHFAPSGRCCSRRTTYSYSQASSILPFARHVPVADGTVARSRRRRARKLQAVCRSPLKRCHA